MYLPGQSQSDRMIRLKQSDLDLRMLGAAFIGGLIGVLIGCLCRELIEAYRVVFDCNMPLP